MLIGQCRPPGAVGPLSQMDQYKRLTLMSLIPVPVMQQAAWISLALEEKNPKALFCFFVYSWPLFLRQELIEEESYRIPFVFTFILSFIHLQHELFQQGIHPLIQMVDEWAKGPNSKQAEAIEKELELEVQRIENDRALENKQAEEEFDMRLALRNMKVPDLKKLAREQNVKGRSKMRKADLVAHLELTRGIETKLRKALS